MLNLNSPVEGEKEDYSEEEVEEEDDGEPYIPNEDDGIESFSEYSEEEVGGMDDREDEEEGREKGGEGAVANGEESDDPKATDGGDKVLTNLTISSRISYYYMLHILHCIHVFAHVLHGATNFLCGSLHRFIYQGIFLVRVKPSFVIRQCITSD